jgi:hypothetical protein
MAELPLYPVREIDLGDWILRLDGMVLELFRRGVQDGAIRHHLKHLAVEAKPRGDTLRLTVGQEIGGLVIGQKIDVPPEHRDEVMAFFAESRRRRDSYSNLG